MMIAVGRHLADSTLFTLLIALICVFMKRRGPAIRYALWLMAVAKFVVPTAVFFRAGESLRGFLPRGQVLTIVPAGLSRWVMPSAVYESSKAATVNWSDLLIIIWLVGAAVAFALWLRTMWNFRVGQKASSHSEPAWFVVLKDRIGLKSNVRLGVSDSASEPALGGFARPVVLIPAALMTQLSAGELQSVVLHELAHAKRRDNWTAAFAHFVACLFWFYPLLWWIEKRLRAERELACDEIVIRCGATADDYFTSILKVCRFHVAREIAGVAGISGSNLKSRKEAIMSVSSDIRARRFPGALVGGLVAAVVGLPLLMGILAPSSVRAADAANGTGFTMARQANAPAQFIEATFGVKSLLLRAKLKNTGSRPINQYRIGWIVVYRDGKTVTSFGQAMNVPAEIVPGAVAQVPDQGVSGKLLNDKPREIMFFVDEARFSTGEVWNANTDSIAGEANSEAQTGASAKDPKTGASFTCVFQSVNYAEGTVIQVADGPEQMCARVLNPDPFANGRPTYTPEWIRTSKALRQRSTSVVHLPAPVSAVVQTPIYCAPIKPPAWNGLCACENTGPFSSGAQVNSAKSAYQLRCDNGDWVQTSTLNVKRP